MGLKVSSIYPIIVNRKVVANKNDYKQAATVDGFVSFDASSSSETMKFQTWYNSKRKSAEPATLVVDGIYGPLTTAAYQSPTGQMYDATLPAVPVKTGITPPVTVPPTDHLPAQTVSLKVVENKEVPMSTTKKILIGSSVVLGLLLVIVLANKKNRAVVTAHVAKIVK